MRNDGPAAPTEKSGAKHADTKALLHYVTKICMRHWPTKHSTRQDVRPATPAWVNKCEAVIDWAEDVASIGDEFDDLVKKANRLGERQHLSNDEGKELAATLADAEEAARYARELG